MSSSVYGFQLNWKPRTPNVIEPIVRIKPELGLQISIDYDTNSAVRAVEAYAGAGMFRGFEIFMRNKPAVDVIMLASRECGICGEHHQFVERIALEMAFGGYAPPPLGLETMMLANDAAMTYDHTAHLVALGGPDWSSIFFKIAGYYPKEIYQLASQTPISKVLETSDAFPQGAPSELEIAGVKIRTVADIMDGLVPIIGSIFLEGAYAWRIWHEAEVMYYLRIPHPITMVPGGIGVPATVENLQRYLQRAIDGTAWLKKQLVIWEVLDLFLADYNNNFGVQAYYDTHGKHLGFAEMGNRPGNFVCYGQSDVSEPPSVEPSSTKVAPYDGTYENADAWGRARIVKPGLVIQPSPNSPPQLVTNNYIDIVLANHEFVESSFYKPWVQGGSFAPEVPKEVAGIENDPIGNKVNYYHPWRKWTIPDPQPRGFPWGAKYSWATSPRWVPYRGHKPISNQFYNAEADPMAVMYAQVLQPQAADPIYRAHYHMSGIEIAYNSNEMSVTFSLPRTTSPRVRLPPELEGEIDIKYIAPYRLSKGKIVTNAIERMRARAFAVALEGVGVWEAWFAALYYLKNGKTDVSRGDEYDWTVKPNTNTGVGIGVGIKEAPRGAIWHSEVVAPGKGPAIATINPQQMQPTTVNSGPRVKNTYDDGVQTVRPAYPTHGQGTFEETIMGNPDANVLGMPKLTAVPLEQWDGFEFAAALRSFDPCFVCGVHIVLPNGRVRYLTLGAPIDLSNAIKTFYKFAMKVK
jgi:hydrogenase large subunit